MLNKEKIFRDPIYGYVSIPERYCKEFIDTEIFQRLRRIEQTSMRVLFPSAHHDRFAHSIGVFYLGQLAFSYLRKNSAIFFENTINDIDWEYYKNTFEIACLLHDCGHSPFSHTFEQYYLYDGKEDIIKEKLSPFFEHFDEEYKVALSAEHEIMSALLVLTHFYDKIKKMGASPELAARMIMGLKHEYELNQKKRFENKLISLLNGSGIDVDSLDYVQRDTWASGVGNVNIDYQRLLSAIMIKPNKSSINIVFSRKVLSVIDNISIGRNFLYKWIYSHHKVIYEQYILSQILKEIDDKCDFCKKVLTFETFTEAVELNEHKYYLPTDDDIIHIIKQHVQDDTKITEFLSRNYQYKALWKTYFEFNNAHFKNVTTDNKMMLKEKIEKGALDEKYGKGNILCIAANPKLKGINQNDFFIEIDGELIDAAEATQQKSENLTYFIAYVTEKLRPHKKEIIEDVLSLQS